MIIHIYKSVNEEDNEPTGEYFAQWIFFSHSAGGQFTSRCNIPAQLVGDDREILWAVVRAGGNPSRDFTIERHY